LFLLADLLVKESDYFEGRFSFVLLSQLFFPKVDLVLFLQLLDVIAFLSFGMVLLLVQIAHPFHHLLQPMTALVSNQSSSLLLKLLKQALLLKHQSLLRPLRL
jgi:hypothetical protein